MKKSLLFILALSFTSQAFASGGERRQIRQQQRIHQGVQSGQLTDGETKRLEKGQARIDKAQSAATADGVITQGEEAKIHHMENKQSRRIHRLKHNDKVQPDTVPATEPPPSN